MPAFDQPKLAQVAIVVRDIEAAKKHYASLLNQAIPETIVTDADVRQEFNNSPTNAQTKLAFFDLGGVQLELVEPMGGNSAWQQGLDENGEGVHHIAFWIPEGKIANEEANLHLQNHGFVRIHRGDMGGDGEFAYHQGPHNLTIETLQHKREL